MRSVKIAVAAAIAIAMATAGQAQTGAGQPVTRQNLVKGSATIQAIDATTRTVTLRNARGDEEIFLVGPEVKRFDELKVGDKLNVTYYEALVFHLRKPGEPSNKAAEVAGFTAAKSKLPAGAIASQKTVTVTVKAVDLKAASITVVTADGRTVTRKVDNVKNLEGVQAGDRIDITYTEGVLMSIERAG